ncbi:MAG: acyltransferase [Proteobacteria bacterium]|nr:acyltransferase [Pseudomonadota bacterium]
MSPQSQAYIPSLTGLRFFAALSVVIAHSLLASCERLPDQFFTYISSLSGLGMPLFFILSGFVIHYTYSKNIIEQGTRALREFAIARFARLYPLYIILFFISLLIIKKRGIEITSLEGLLRFITLTQTWDYEIIGTHSLVYYLTMLQNSWSISTEIFLYFLYPLILFLMSRLKSTHSYIIFGFTSIFFAAFFMYMIFINIPFINQMALSTFGPTADYNTSSQNSFIRWFVYFSPFFWIFLFASGCCAAAIFINLRQKPISRWENKISSFLLGLSLIYILIAYAFMFTNNTSNTFHHFVKFSHYNWGLSPALTIIIFCCARYQNAFSQFMATPIFVKLGDASYSLYLLHALVFSIALRFGFVSSFSPPLKFVVLVFSALVASVASYHIIEVPCRSFLRNKLLKKKLATNF